MKTTILAASCALFLGGLTTADTINVPGDYPMISEAVDASNPGDTIMVDAGTYMDMIIVEDDCPLSIIGAVNKDGSPAVIVQSTGGDDGILRVGWNSGAAFVCENIVLEGGFGSTYAGGAFVYHSWNVEFRNCIFRDNVGANRGGGVYLEYISSNQANVRFVDCTFANNTASKGGGVAVYESIHTPVLFENCSFTGNVADYEGGALYIADAYVTCVNTSVIGNETKLRGGGLFVAGSPDYVVSLMDAIISGNTGIFGGGLACYEGTVTGGVFENNTATYGGGIWLEDSDPTLNGVVVRENHGIGNGGGVYTSDVSNGKYPDVIASTICGNTPNQVWHIEGDNTNIINESCESNPAACCVNGACIMVEPLMCDDVGGTLSNGGEEDCSSTECAEPCLGDVNNDSEINVNDLLTVIANWGGCP